MKGTIYNILYKHVTASCLLIYFWSKYQKTNISKFVHMSLKVRVGCALFQKNTSLLHEEKKINEENTGEAFAIWLIKLIKDRTKKKTPNI